MNNCPNCNQSCNNGDCGCIPQGMTTPNYCPADLPSCPNPSPCNETFDSNCVYYTGPDLDCLGIEKDDTVQDVIQTIANALEPFLCLECTSLAVPANAATNIPVNQSLTWNAVPGAIAYDVYLGTSSTNLTLVSLGQILTTYTPPVPLLEGTVYYWKVVPKNDAGVPKTTCPVYTFTTYQFECTNPIKYFLDNLLTQPLTPEDFGRITSALLSSGQLITDCNICCPDCTETKRYVIASAATYALYYPKFYSLPSCLPECCIQKDVPLTVYQESLLALFTETPPPTNCCDNNFGECSQNIKNLLDEFSYIVYENGIVEESTINGSSGLCLFVNFLNSLPTAFTLEDKANLLNLILSEGLVIDCRPEGVLISDIDRYIKYMEDIGLTCPPPPPL
jgi:hypothetical protein